MALTGKIMDFFADKAMTIPAFPRTKVKAVSDDNGVGLNVLLDDKQKKHIAPLVVLPASGWSNNMQIISVSGVTENNSIIIAPAPISFAEYGVAGIYCAVQANGKLTFRCSSAPSVDISVNVLIFD